MRRTFAPAVGRRAVLVTLVVFVASFVLPVTGASAQAGPAGSAAELEQRVRAARAASDAAVEQFQAATARHAALVDEITAVEKRVEESRARATELRRIAQSRAVAAYTNRDHNLDTSTAWFTGDDVMEEIRRATLLDRANARDNAAIAQLRVLEEDLGVQKADLQEKRDVAARLVAELESEKAALAVALADAQRAYDDLVARLAREAASRAAAERAAQQAVAVTRRPATTGTPVAGFLCPVRGSFTDDYGDARSGGRSHTGTDVFAATGTPVVAVTSGSLRLESGGAGGNAAYLSAGGNNYYFAHFSSYAGGARSVSQGEVIGYVGMTGNASAPHLHFEIRTSSGPVNPFPTLRASC